MIPRMIKLMLNQSSTPGIWKLGKTILIFKDDDLNDPGNWRPITLTLSFRELFLANLSRSSSIRKSLNQQKYPKL
jgi:hypothetical protein